MTHIESATRYMVILGRTYADGTEADYRAVNALQAQYKIIPLAAWGKAFKPVPPLVDANPGISMTDKPQEVILAMGTEGYFNWMSKRMCEAAPAYPADAPMLAEMEKIEENQSSLGQEINGWLITKGLGVYDANYLKRAVVAAFGWPANLQADAVYPYTKVDAKGETLNGSNNYTLTFAKGETPPVNGFWSITMYMIDQGWWFVPNPLNKFTVSMRDKPKFNPDGSLTLYFQNETPGKDKEANWLPAPKGDFIPMLRMYWPKDTSPSILNGSWTPPPILKAN
jgi:hypothetical protein